VEKSAALAESQAYIVYKFI